jgi:hypothetical protein
MTKQSLQELLDIYPEESKVSFHTTDDGKTAMLVAFTIQKQRAVMQPEILYVDDGHVTFVGTGTGEVILPNIDRAEIGPAKKIMVPYEEHIRVVVELPEEDE